VAKSRPPVNVHSGLAHSNWMMTASSITVAVPVTAAPVRHPIDSVPNASSPNAIIHLPSGFSLGPVPSGTSFARSARGPLDVVLLFTRTLADLRRRFPTAARALDPAGRLWVAWPKKAAEIETDLSFEVVQRTGLDAGLVDNKSGSIDEVYQGLQFVVRLKDRPKRTSERLS